MMTGEGIVLENSRVVTELDTRCKSTGTSGTCRGRPETSGAQCGRPIIFFLVKIYEERKGEISDSKEVPSDVSGRPRQLRLIVLPFLTLRCLQDCSPGSNAVNLPHQIMPLKL